MAWPPNGVDDVLKTLFGRIGASRAAEHIGFEDDTHEEMSNEA